MDSKEQGGEELLHKTPKPKSALAAREEEVLAFWNTEKIFEKSLLKPAPKGEYVFYDGPPFASGLPHYGHILASTIKDAIPRYRTMQGYYVARRWGWDCHGLPVENLVEKELGFKTKRDIEQFGIAKFNETARVSIMKDVADWKRVIPRLGRWADMDRDYKTMDTSYTESVWWAFKTLHKKGLIYEGFKAMHYCPRCGTTLSNNEVALGYKDIDDISVTVKLTLLDEADTSLLIWTTTPWTLPGNAAAAVNKEAIYVKAKLDGEYIILAKERLSIVAPEAEIVKEFLGKELVGKKYLPPFDYFADQIHKHKTHAWKVYAADYVTLDSGTGIVHIAPSYGAEDLELAQKEKIPLIHHVTDEGKFIATVRDFAGLPVKSKGNPRETDTKVAAFLKEKGLLFAEEKINHSYPHCWRCDTPLLNWAANSWFVKVSALKSKLVKENERIGWTPEHVGKGRFHNGLLSAPDWAISRSRYWGAPLPVWRHSKTKEIKIIGSAEELLTLARRSGNRYFVMRHGEARSNIEGFINSDNTIDNHLTEQGRATVKKNVEAFFSKNKIDLIVASPLTRTQETAQIARSVLGLSDSELMTDERLREIGAGIYNGKPMAEWEKQFESVKDKFIKSSEGGETYADLRRRVGKFLFDVERRYTGKNILIVTHGSPAWLLESVAAHLDSSTLVRDVEGFLEKGSIREFSFTPFPHNDNYELDLHRPYIDEIALGDTLKGEWQRVPDVFDCWFESGSMAFASNAYPQKKDGFNPGSIFGLGKKKFPADFIAEGLDQTRGWFYSMLVLGTALFGRSPYKNVIVNGLILAENGEKMSKRLKNYPDPLEVVEQYGADAVRYYLLSSSVIRAEDLRFSARGVEDVQKKLLMRLDNVRSFYDLYANGTTRATTSTNILDRWILSRLGEVIQQTTDGFERYQLDTATRPLGDFIDDLSTWYVRRSRDRFKAKPTLSAARPEGFREAGEDMQHALATLRYVLYTLSHVMAPVMPFFADDLFKRVKEENDAESVHLSVWPTALPINTELQTGMERVREVSSLGLKAREASGIKIRQPLGKLSVKTIPSDAALRALVAEEVNVKEVVEDATLQEEVVLDTEITPELREEGTLRDFVRTIQELRKQEGLSIGDRPKLRIATDITGQKFVEIWKDTLMEETGLSDIQLEPKQEDVAATTLPFPVVLSLQK